MAGPRSFRILKDDGPIGRGASGGRLVQIPAYCKTNEVIRYSITNEYLAERIGRFVGLPIAPGAIVQVTAQPHLLGYASLDFSLAGEGLPALDPVQCWEKMPDESTGLVLFDILIANPDRHAANASALLQDEPYKLMIFDHGHALFGKDQSGGITRLTDLRDRLGCTGGSVTGETRQCLLNHINKTDYFEKWIKRIELIPEHLIDTACNDLEERDLIDASERAAVTDFIQYRIKQIRKFIDDNHSEFPSIAQWPLL